MTELPEVERREPPACDDCGEHHEGYGECPAARWTIKCPVHTGTPEPCPTCSAYIAAGL